MPYARKNKIKRVAYKKRPRRNVKKGPTTMRLTRGSPCADTAIVKLRYVDNFTFSSGIGIATHYTFRANGIYDPNYTGTGHQPMGFDQWNNFYSKWVVIGSRIKVTVWSNGTSASADAGMVGVVLQNEVSSVTDITTLRERNFGRFKALTNASGSAASRTVSCNYSPRKHFGIPKNEVEDDQYTGTASADPSRQGYYSCYWLPVASSVTDNAIYGTAEIEYIVKYFDRHDLSGS